MAALFRLAQKTPSGAVTVAKNFGMLEEFVVAQHLIEFSALHEEILPSILLVAARWPGGDRKSTRLNSSHVAISYAVFCLKKNRCSVGSEGPARPARHPPRPPWQRPGYGGRGRRAPSARW